MIRFTKSLLACCLVGMLFSNAASSAQPTGAAASSPEDYLAGLFAQHDIVFVGEYHGIAQNIEFLSRLVPKLYAKGVYSLGFEFVRSREQPLLDKLLTAETYDEAFVNSILRNYQMRGRADGRVAGFESSLTQETRDLMYTVWKFNRELPAGAQRFRIVGIDSYDVFWHNDEGPADEQGRLIGPALGRGSNVKRDMSWAQTIFREILDRGDKGLIYSGAGHATHRFIHQRHGQLWITASNLVAQHLGDRSTSVMLHGFGVHDGVAKAAEAIIARERLPSAGFGIDLKDSALGRLPLPEEFRGCVGSKCADSGKQFTLAEFTDGYVFLTPVLQWRASRVSRSLITAANRELIQLNLAGYVPGQPMLSTELLYQALNERTEQQMRDYKDAFVRSSSPVR